MEEVWKDIPGYEGFYKVSNQGRVMSIARNGTKGGILVGDTSKLGYIRVFLYKNNKAKRYLVHRLVAQAFLSNPNNLPCINHKDCNPQNNAVTNLEYCDWAYNNTYNGRAIKARATKTNNNSYGAEKQIAQYTLDGKLVKVWTSLNEAKRSGFSCGNICLCCKGVRNYHKGYKWAYA